MKIKISINIREKLFVKHNVNINEIDECFLNREKGFLEDIREKNRTHPPTQWFVAQTDRGRVLKVVFIQFEDGSIVLKTAYEPSKQEVNIYDRNA